MFSLDAERVFCFSNGRVQLKRRVRRNIGKFFGSKQKSRYLLLPL
jgi:hypothetical protein